MFEICVIAGTGDSEGVVAFQDGADGCFSGSGGQEEEDAHGKEPYE